MQDHDQQANLGTGSVGPFAAFPIQKTDLPNVWPLIAAYLQGTKGGINDLWSLTDLYTELLVNHNKFLWVGWDRGDIESVMTVNFIRTTKSSVCWIENIHSDNIRKYLKFIPCFEGWAAMMGATEIYFDGSKAWTKLLKRFGYTNPTAMMKKHIGIRWSN